MSSNEDVSKMQKYVKKHEPDLVHIGSSRRTIAMMPNAMDERQILITEASKFRQLLLSIQGKQTTCCLKIVSSKRKSRSAVLIFRGRVLGCIHGNKRLAEQVFGKQAYEYTLAEMAQDSVIEGHLLAESLALAAASLFHSEIVDVRREQPSQSTFAAVYNKLVKARRPGCIFINDRNGLAVVAVYLFAGQVIGVYSYSEGWAPPTYEAAVQYLSQTQDANICASMLSARDLGEIQPLTFALSNLEDGKAVQSIETQAFNLSGLLVNIKPIDGTTFSNLNRFVPAGSKANTHRTMKDIWREES